MLPNDERVWAAKGAKRVMLKSIMEGKFKDVQKTASIFMDPAQQGYLNNATDNDWVLFHEFCHALGPVSVDVNGVKKTVRECLGEMYLPIEEAKSDTVAIWGIIELMKQGKYPSNLKKSLMTGFLLRCVSAARYGTEEAHGKGAIASFNYMLEKGAFVYDAKTERYSVNYDKFEEAITSLSTEFLEIEADGDRKKAEEFFKKYAVITPELQKTADKMKHLPKDMLPLFEIKNLE